MTEEGQLGESGLGTGADEALARAEELLERLKTTRAELERVAATDDPEAAIDVLGDLAELAKAVESELAQARARAERP